MSLLWRIYASLPSSTIGLYSGLPLVRHQAIIWTNAVMSLIGPLGRNFSEIPIKIHWFSFKKKWGHHVYASMWFVDMSFGLIFCIAHSAHTISVIIPGEMEQHIKAQNWERNWHSVTALFNWALMATANRIKQHLLLEKNKKIKWIDPTLENTIKRLKVMC